MKLCAQRLIHFYSIVFHTDLSIILLHNVTCIGEIAYGTDVKTCSFGSEEYSYFVGRDSCMAVCVGSQYAARSCSYDGVHRQIGIVAVDEQTYIGSLHIVFEGIPIESMADVVARIVGIAPAVGIGAQYEVFGIAGTVQRYTVGGYQYPVIPIFLSVGAVGEDDAEGHAVLSEHLDEAQVDALGLEADVHEHEEVVELLAAQYPCVHGVSLMRNFGQHNGLMCAMHYAKGDYILGMDVCGSTPENTYIFEDSFNGLKSARSAGGHVIGLATTNGRKEIAPFSDRVLDDFTGMTPERIIAGE